MPTLSRPSRSLLRFLVKRNPLLFPAYLGYFAVLGAVGLALTIKPGITRLEPEGSEAVALLLKAMTTARWGGLGVALLAVSSGTTAGYGAWHEVLPAIRSHSDLFFVAVVFGMWVLVSKLSRALKTAHAETNACQQELQTHSEQIIHQRSFIEATTNDLGLGVIAVNAEGVFTFCSPAAAELLGWEQDELLGQRAYPAIIAPEEPITRASEAPTALALLDWVAATRGSVVLRRKSGQPFPATVSAAPLWMDSETMGAVFHFRDETEQQALQAWLSKQAFHDPVTQLANRALFINRLEQAIASLDRQREQLAVMFLDLDHFKSVNDALGHAAGDELLRHVAVRFQECLRKGDTLARFGGDEFTVLLTGIRDPAVAQRIARRFLRQLERPFLVSGREVMVDVSIGIAVGTASNAAADELLRKADVALYQAKRAGRGQYVVFEETMTHGLPHRVTAQEALLGAMERGELRVFYQPEVDLESGGITGVEALVRWQHPERGLLAPAEFLPTAEATGQIFALGQWVRQQACTQVAEWNARRARGSALAVSINLSTQELMHPELLSGLQQMLAETAMDPQHVRIEISEAVLLEHPTLAARLLPALKEMRLQVLIDDFGAGCASVGCLRQFPLDGLKLDRSFVKELTRTGSLAQWVQAVTQLAQVLHISVSAEGVEVAEQRDQLRAAGCSRAQGFLFSPPSEAAGITRLLA